MKLFRLFGIILITGFLLSACGAEFVAVTPTQEVATWTPLPATVVPPFWDTRCVEDQEPINENPCLSGGVYNDNNQYVPDTYTLHIYPDQFGNVTPLPIAYEDGNIVLNMEDYWDGDVELLLPPIEMESGLCYLSTVTARVHAASNLVDFDGLADNYSLQIWGYKDGDNEPLGGHSFVVGEGVFRTINDLKLRTFDTAFYSNDPQPTVTLGIRVSSIHGVGESGTWIRIYSIIVQQVSRGHCALGSGF
jgi:hypothetical protein